MIIDRRDRLLLLHRVLSREKIRFLHDIDPTFEKIFLQSPSNLSEFFQLSSQQATKLYRYLHDNSFYEQIITDKRTYNIITIDDKNYPSLLKHIHDPPLVLYTLGDLALLQESPSISVIGTRNPSNQAALKLSMIVKPLIEEGWVIVSGMAYGIDSLAHKLCLEEGGKTIAVLGGGFEHIYPANHMGLFENIAQNGLVLSEYPPQIKARKQHFPERNRIISGLGLATLVIEASERSGTFITVDQALEQGRDVYAVPDSPLHRESAGCLTLIAEGAKLVKSAADIMEDWPIK